MLVLWFLRYSIALSLISIFVDGYSLDSRLTLASILGLDLTGLKLWHTVDVYYMANVFSLSKLLNWESLMINMALLKSKGENDVGWKKTIYGFSQKAALIEISFLIKTSSTGCIVLVNHPSLFSCCCISRSGPSNLLCNLKKKF